MCLAGNIFSRSESALISDGDPTCCPLLRAQSMRADTDRGNTVLIPSTVQHSSSPAWGDNVDKFYYKRFVKPRKHNSVAFRALVAEPHSAPAATSPPPRFWPSPASSFYVSISSRWVAMAGTLRDTRKRMLPSVCPKKTSRWSSFHETARNGTYSFRSLERRWKSRTRI